MEGKRESHNLRDLLGIKDDSGTSGGLTLLAILSSDNPAARHVQSNGEHVQLQQPSQSNRTLLDILREEQRTSTTPHHSRIRWSLLKNIVHRRSSNNVNSDDAAAAPGPTEEEAPARMSLMALLAENDVDGFGSFGHAMYAEEEEESSYVNNSCCVCMVRHKGAAFIPCGHTFCRLCSRELWVQRGDCPLCNNYILEILDIF